MTRIKQRDSIDEKDAGHILSAPQTMLCIFRPITIVSASEMEVNMNEATVWREAVKGKVHDPSVRMVMTQIAIFD